MNVLDHNAYILKLKEELATPGFLTPEKLRIVRADYVSSLKAKSAELSLGHQKPGHYSPGHQALEQSDTKSS
jgi:hypothetical protein